MIILVVGTGRFFVTSAKKNYKQHLLTAITQITPSSSIKKKEIVVIGHILDWMFKLVDRDFC